MFAFEANWAPYGYGYGGPGPLGRVHYRLHHARVKKIALSRSWGGLERDNLVDLNFFSDKVSDNGISPECSVIEVVACNAFMRATKDIFSIPDRRFVSDECLQERRVARQGG